MSRYYVTCGKESAESKTPGVDTGKWECIENENKDQIKKLRNDLPLADESVDVRRDNISLPSPWANIILFDSMINSTDKSFGTLQEKAIVEWRALITLLAIKDILGLQVQFDTISLRNDYNMTNADAEFFHKMYSMRPLNGLFNDSWSEITFIKIDNIAIGVITDSNIVCSAYNYTESTATKKLIEHGLMDENYEWIDPTPKLKNDVVLSVFVANWLKCINNYISRIENSNRLSDLIGNFRNELLSEQYISLLADNTDFITFTISDIPIDNSFDLLKAVNVAKIIIDTPEITDRIKIKNENEVYLLDFISKSFRNIYEAYGQNCQLPQTGKLIGKTDIFMDNITFMAKRDTNGVESAQKDIVMLNNEYNEMVSHQMILPIKEEVFEFLSSTYIRDNIVINCRNPEEYIEILITFYDASHNPIQLSKKYYENEYRIIEEITNDIVIWPYAEFINENNTSEKIWNEYYVYSHAVQYDGTFEYLVKFDNLIMSDVQMTNWQKDKNHEQGHPKVYCLKQLPTYLSVISRDFGELQKYGLLFLKKPKIYEVNKNKRCHIGVDFGTTSTTAFFQADEFGSSEQFVSFLNEKDVADSSLRRNGKYVVCKYIEKTDNFMNEKYPKRMSYSSLIEHKESGNENILICEEPFKWGNIIYNQLDVDNNPKVMRNMKWGMDVDSKNAIESYLGQFTKMISFKLACLGFGSFVWKFSYPTSLSRNMIDTYKARTKRLVESINNLNLSSQLNQNGTYFSESIVSAKFYKSNENYICIDIGGGSTDVSVWKGVYDDVVVNIMQFSVGIASRKIFLQAFADLLISSDDNDTQNDFVKMFRESLRRGDIQHEAVGLQVDNIKKLIEDKKMKKEDYNNFVFCIEPGILVADNKMKDFIFQSNREKSGIFFKKIIVGLWGLLYYTAISIGHVKDKFAEEDIVIPLHFAGTGSKMYSWIEDEYGSVIKEAFEKVLNKVLFDDYEANKVRVDFNYSEEDLKTEAARGLLRMDKADERDSIANIYLKNCGEIVLKANNSNLLEDIVIGENDNVCANEYIESFFSANNDKKVSAIEIKFDPNDENDPFIQYIKIMNEMFFETAEEKIELKDIDRITMNKKIRDVIEENKKNHTVASSFIIKLEALMEYLRDC